MINISYLNTPLTQDAAKLKDSMYLTADPLYKNISMEFNDLHKMVSSDYRQYSPFVFVAKTKKSENWNNINQDLIILDIDDGLTIEQAKQEFKDYKHLICTTKSHQKEKKGLTCDRFRVILESDNVPIGDDYFIMTDLLEIRYQFIDKQVNTKTGAFLGFADCEYWYNDGKLFDCQSALRDGKRIKKAKAQEKQAVREPRHDLPIDQIKQSLDQSTVSQIVESCGFEVNRNFKFKYRDDERTPSASISKDGYIKDFGSDMAGDAISFVQEVKQVNFKEAVSVVAGFVNIRIEGTA